MGRAAESQTANKRHTLNCEPFLLLQEARFRGLGKSDRWFRHTNGTPRRQVAREAFQAASGLDRMGVCARGHQTPDNRKGPIALLDTPNRPQPWPGP